VSFLNPFSCKIQIFNVRVKVSYLKKNETLKIFNKFSRENHGHGGYEHGVHRGALGGKLSFKNMSAGSPLYFARKPPFLGPESRPSKLDHLTVYSIVICSYPGRDLISVKDAYFIHIFSS
jgi:hypothetical protein